MHDEYKIFLYCEKQLSNKESHELKNHLATCEDCRKILHHYKSLNRKTKRFYFNLKNDEHRIIYLPKVSYAIVLIIVFFIAWFILFRNVSDKQDIINNYKNYDKEIFKIQHQVNQLEKDLNNPL